MPTNKFYVYEHWRFDTNKPFYVGKGSGNRAYQSIGRNYYWYNVVKELEEKGQPYETRFVSINLLESTALELEKQRIDFWCSKNIKLSNILDKEIISSLIKEGQKNGKKPGRPKIDKPLTQVERNRRYREKKKREEQDS